MPPAAPPSVVAIAARLMTSLRPTSAPAEPQLKPYQPNQSTRVPSAANGTLWPGMGLMEPSLL